MPKNMDPFVFLRREGLLTDLTDVGLLTRVQPEMGGQWLVFLEGHAADVACERVVLQVTVRVVLLLNLVKITILILSSTGTIQIPNIWITEPFD